ncbi:MAG TPA: histidine kinase [Bryobacteraceae bacterium]|nr:histidine kinase [Bryobacteraceae bacterium]
MRKRRWAGLAAIFSGWSLFATCMALQAHYNHQVAGEPISWARAFGAELTYAYLWALLTPAILWLARRFRADHRGWYRVAPLHVVGCVVFSAVQKTAYILLVPPSSPEWRAHDLASLARSVLITMDYGVLLYAIILLIYYALDYYTCYQKGRVRAAQLEARLAQAKLRALRMQLQPHFLFNTLHSISTLVHENPESAEAMIARLSELLRLSLENAGGQQVPLSQEIAFVERYLEIERIRFEDRLQIRFNIDPQTLDAEVPNLILQPLVENAIRHGISQRSGGRIEIRARREGEQLLLQVLDDGAGLCAKADAVSGVPGVGLRNTRARLKAIYGNAHNFVLRAASKGGVEAAIRIPFRPRPQASGDDGNGKNQDADRR